MSPLLRRRRGGVAVYVAVALLAAGCRSREVEKDLRITDIKTGWYDAGIVDGQNKLVPSISFKLQNISGEAISRVKMNAVFHTVDAPQDAWGDHLIQAIDSDALEAGATGGSLVLRSPRGYTGSEPRLVMLKNSQFVDATVSVFGRHGSRNWIKLGDFRIDRQLLTE
jgi:hypothetical protein